MSLRELLGFPRKDYFASSIDSYLHDLIDASRLATNFGLREQQVFRLFYNERLKVRTEKMPQFQIYAALCDGKHESEWGVIVAGAQVALSHLVSIGFITEAVQEWSTMLNSYVGHGAQLYQLTAKGLEVLQSWHAPVGLRVRAWIAVMPPWLVLAGSIAGGVTSLWKIIDWSRAALTSLK